MAGGNSTSQGISSAHQAAYTVVWGIALAVNLTNCIILGRTAYVKRSCPNLLTFLLTVVDVWVLLAGLLPAVVALFEQDLLENYAGLCSYQAVIINSWFIVASSLVVIIAFDRYLAVCHPFDYSRRFAGTSSLYIVSIFVPIVTFFALILACLPLMLGRGFRVVPPGIYCFITWGSRDARDVAVTVINLVYCFIVLLLLTGLTVAVCCGIYKMVRAGRERTGDRSNNRVQQSQNALEILFAKLGIVMAIVFSACTMPASVNIMNAKLYGLIIIVFKTLASFGFASVNAVIIMYLFIICYPPQC